MKLSSLSYQVPVALAVVDHVVQARRRFVRQQIASRAGYVGVGLVVGAAASLLFTPRSGAATRRKLGEHWAKAIGAITKDELPHELPQRHATNIRLHSGTRTRT